jgi:DNA repair exonuclease SbcCD ATPase subunit
MRNKISSIAHLADIHIRKIPTRHEEYEQVFNNLFKSLKEKKPDRIVVVGDLGHDYLDLGPEQLVLAKKFLRGLSDIAPVRITRGNHDFRQKNSKRLDSVAAIVDQLDSDIIYYNKTGFYYDENVCWAVWHHGGKKKNPWKTKDGKKILAYKDQDSYTYIDLFHDPIYGGKSTTGFDLKKKSYYKLRDFKGDYSFLGDIHLKQIFSNNSKAYSGSLIAQDFSEGDDQFHGYLLWNLEDENIEEISVHNDYSFKNIKLTPFTDFDDLDFDIENPTKHMRIRIVWSTLPSARNNENERKVTEYIRECLSNENILLITHKNEFVEDDVIDVNDNVTINDINNQEVQYEIFNDYLNKIGYDDDIINDVINLDDNITKRIKLDENTNIKWSISKFGAENFMSYEKIDINWDNDDGLYQISGINTAGKTTILKLISYILFGETLETEIRKKFGDSRFVNDKNDIDYCEGYMILEANGEYYGIKRRTDIERKKGGEIKGAPTKVWYYVLNSPNDELNDEKSIDILTEDNKNKTQKRINEIIGSYQNFKRVVLTTSDTLNRILSNDMAVFIDSLLFDSGLDVFDKKLNALKNYQKEINKKSRITCNVEATTNENKKYKNDIEAIENEINEIENVDLPDVKNRIKKGEEYIETLTKKLFKINPEIANLNIENTKDNIRDHNEKINQYKARNEVINNSIKTLKDSYDENKLNELIEKRDKHKEQVYNLRLKIKELERENDEENHKIEIVNGKIHLAKQEGRKIKEEIKELKESKICPTCGQPLDKNHQHNIEKSIKEKETKMFKYADEIKEHQKTINEIHKPEIDNREIEIENINKNINDKSLQMEDVLNQIGELTNDKNDVEKRRELIQELEQIPTKIENEELKKLALEKKIDEYNNSLTQIEENKKIQKKINAAKERINILRTDETDYNETILIKKNEIANKSQKIKDNEQLISDFKTQEYQDKVFNIYKKCVHRDGIPRQLLTNHIIPKINIELGNVLSVAPFKVWLDVDDLRPKLAYYKTPNSIIDAISGSGKERTFASIVLKMALNEINVKSKPTIFLLDEIMGKLDNQGSVDEFIEILQIIKEKYKKFLIIEQMHEVNPDYLISVSRTENGISSMVIE